MSQFHYWKKAINTSDVDIKKILVSDEFSHGKKQGNECKRLHSKTI